MLPPNEGRTHLMKDQRRPNLTLAPSITRAASQQTYYTIGLLADRDRVADAYRAYAYFRWVDDTLDGGSLNRADRRAFVQRQAAILDGCYRGDPIHPLSEEENMLARLIKGDWKPGSGLWQYLCQMMAVMDFDAERRGRLISSEELERYTHWLAAGVTEAMHYFIGHESWSPRDESRYLAVTGAHITHMLRDYREDVASGYTNIPREVLDAYGLDPRDTSSVPFRRWVKNRVYRAQTCFDAGRDYLYRVENRRCRVAGLAYIARFESVLETIRRDDYTLRANYPGFSPIETAVRMALATRELAWPPRRAHKPAYAFPAVNKEPR